MTDWLTGPERDDYTLGVHSGKVTSVGAGGATAWVTITTQAQGTWQFGPCKVPDSIRHDQVAVGDHYTTITDFPLLPGQTVTVLIERDAGAFILARYS